ncbi:MAG: PAS domain-containing protein, partial [Pseudomonadota bacterium]
MDHDPTKSPSLVSLTERRRARRHPAIIQVEGYWESLRSDRLVPDRSEVDPRGLAGADAPDGVRSAIQGLGIWSDRDPRYLLLDGVGLLPGGP